MPDDLRDVSLLDCLRVASEEQELVHLPGDECRVDSEAAAAAWCLAQAGCTLQECGAYLRGERMAS